MEGPLRKAAPMNLTLLFRGRSITGSRADSAACQSADERTAAPASNRAQRRAATRADQGATRRALSRIVCIRATRDGGDHNEADRA